MFSNEDYLAELLAEAGLVSADEAARFERHPYFDQILQMRRWDEQAKIPGLPTPDMAHYLSLINA